MDRKEFRSKRRLRLRLTAYFIGTLMVCSVSSAVTLDEFKKRLMNSDVSTMTARRVYFVGMLDALIFGDDALGMKTGLQFFCPPRGQTLSPALVENLVMDFVRSFTKSPKFPKETDMSMVTILALNQAFPCPKKRSYLDNLAEYGER